MTLLLIKIPWAMLNLRLQKSRSMKIIHVLVLSLITLSCFSQGSKNQSPAFGNDPKHGKYLNHRGFKMY